MSIHVGSPHLESSERLAPTLIQRCAEANCRACQCRGLEAVLDLGMMPLAEHMPTASMLDEPEARFPLEVAHCPDCALVQILETVSPERLFGERYTHYASFSPPLLEHARRSAQRLMHMRSLDRRSLVVELGSNDGYLLRNFVKAGIPVLGIEPAPGQARVANEHGVPTRSAFFNGDLAEELVAEGRRADVVIANCVLPHVSDLSDFVRGIAGMLKDEGIAVLEVPYVRELINNCEFDTIDHGHLCYFSVTALDALLSRNGLWLYDLEPVTAQGGGLRLYVRRHRSERPRVNAMLAEEQACGMTGSKSATFYGSFKDRVDRLAHDLRALLCELRDRKQRLAAYGATGKGTIMLNYLGFDHTWIEFVVDRNVHKHGRYIPGVRVPIRPVAALGEQMPPYTLLLAWDCRREVLAQQRLYRQRGGWFIVPVPAVMVV